MPVLGTTRKWQKIFSTLKYVITEPLASSIMPSKAILQLICNLFYATFDFQAMKKLGKWWEGKMNTQNNNLQVWCLQNDMQYLLDEWDYEKNGALTPFEVSKGSERKVWWRCSKGHGWEATVGSRTHMKSGCPYCAGKKAIKGETDIMTLYPEIAEEWHPNKNGDLKPSDVTTGSGKKVWWLGKCGHEWQAQVSNRIYENSGCPICDKENHTSFAEQALLFYVKKYFPDTVNSNQEVIGMELDIYIPSLKIAIEYDSLYRHKDYNGREQKKNQLCEDNNILLIRIREEGLELYDDCHCIVRTNIQSNYSLSEVIKKVLFDIDNILETDIDIDRDSMLIYSQYIKTPKKKNLKNSYPELAEEWHPTKNEKITADMIPPKSEIKVWWLGKCNHEWQAVVSSRVRGNGCPCCDGKVTVQGFNDLATTNPDFLQEWDYDNNEIKPTEVTAGSNKKVWWKCQVCGNRWQAKISHKTRGRGCPECGKIKQGKNKVRNLLQVTGSLEEKCPELAKEWHPVRNGDLKPCDVTTGSHKKIWWECHICGHEWEAVIKSRVSGCGCPQCGRRKSAKSRNKPVMCVETGTVYPSMKDVEDKTGINQQCISNCCIGKQHTAGGYHWKYVEAPSN